MSRLSWVRARLLNNVSLANGLVLIIRVVLELVLMGHLRQRTGWENGLLTGERGREVHLLEDVRGIIWLRMVNK